MKKLELMFEYTSSSYVNTLSKCCHTPSDWYDVVLYYLHIIRAKSFTLISDEMYFLLQIYELSKVFFILPVYTFCVYLFLFLISSISCSSSAMLYVIIYRSSLPQVVPELHLVIRVAGGNIAVDVSCSFCFWPLLKAKFWKNWPLVWCGTAALCDDKWLLKVRKTSSIWDEMQFLVKLCFKNVEVHSDKSCWCVCFPELFDHPAKPFSLKWCINWGVSSAVSNLSFF